HHGGVYADGGRGASPSLGGLGNGQGRPGEHGDDAAGVPAADDAVDYLPTVQRMSRAQRHIVGVKRVEHMSAVEVVGGPVVDAGMEAVAVETRVVLVRQEIVQGLGVG